MKKQLEALTMQRRIAAVRLSELAGKNSTPATKVAPKPKNGKTVLHPTPVLSLKPQ